MSKTEVTKEKKVLLDGKEYEVIKIRHDTHLIKPKDKNRPKYEPPRPALVRSPHPYARISGFGRRKRKKIQQSGNRVSD